MIPIKPGPTGSRVAASRKPWRVLHGLLPRRSDKLDRMFDAMEWKRDKPLAESLRGVISDTKTVDGKE